MSKLIKELEELPRFNSGDNSCFDLIELLDVIEIINKHQITEATNDSTAIELLIEAKGLLFDSLAQLQDLPAEQVDDLYERIDMFIRRADLPF